VLAIDLPGHGRSKLTGDVSLGAFAAATERTLKAAGLSSFHLISHSLGSAVAIQLACLSVFHIRSLALLSPAGLGSEIDREFLDNFLVAATEEELQKSMVRLVTDPDRIAPPFVRTTLRQRRDSDLVVAQRRIRAMLFPEGRQAFSIKPQLEQMSVRAVIVFGRKDMIIPCGHASALPDRIAIHYLENVGHLPYIEAPDAVAALLRDLIRFAESGGESEPDSGRG
jgi:pimeloyl-ACP methyl ester carboxylesterase